MSSDTQNNVGITWNGGWWGFEPRPTRCKRVALPAELTTLFILKRKDLSQEEKFNADPHIEPALD